MQQGAQRGGSRGIRVPPTGAPVEILEVHVRLRGRGVQQLQEVRELLDEHRDRVLAYVFSNFYSNFRLIFRKL